ncbi:MAG: methylmalonyl-CoA epimerase [Candidatus Eiseniibacteriota bacterium]
MSRHDAPRGGSPVSGLSHIAMAVREADPLVAILVGALGAIRGEEELLDGGGLRVVFVRLGSVTLELLEPRSPDHTVARFLEKRGEGLHHVSFEVGNLEAALAGCRAAGIQLLDEAARPGAHGTRVAFLHPKRLGGVLVELCQAGPAASDRDPRP